MLVACECFAGTIHKSGAHRGRGGGEALDPLKLELTIGFEPLCGCWLGH